MKKIVIVVAVIIALIAGIYVVTNVGDDKYDYEIAQITEYNYYIYKENDLYGVINKSGEIVINASYESIIIPNPDKDLFVCENDDTTMILDSNNKELFTEYDSVAPIKLKNIASTLSYEKSVLMYEEDGLYGLIDFEGKKITKNIYESIENLQPTEGKFLVKKDDKYGVIDLKGNTVVKTQYDKISSDGYYTDENGYKQSGFLVLVTTDDGYKYGYIDYTGNKILDTEYNDIERISVESSDIYLIVSENGKYGIYKNSKKKIDHEYQDISYMEDVNLVILQKNKKYGVSTLDGEIIIAVENTTVDSKGIYLYVEKDNSRIVYDTNGNQVDMNYNRCVYKTDNENYMISTLLNNDITYYGIVDKDGNQIVNESYRYIEYIYDDYFIVKDDEGNLGIINANNEIIIELKYSSMQTIKGKKIIKAINAETKETEFYSSNMENTVTITSPTIADEDEYLKIYNDEATYYLDNNGEIIENIDDMEDISYPDQIGEYTKKQMSLETIYYTKE